MALDDVYQVTATQLLAGKELANTFFYVETTASIGGPDGVADALAQEFQSVIWSLWWRNLVSPDVELTSVFAARISPVASASVTRIYSGEFGARGAQAIPNGSAVLVSARDSSNSPNFRRRFYFSGLPEIDSEDSGMTDSILLAWDLFAFQLETLVLNPLITGIGAYTPCAFSKKLFAAGPPPIPWAFLASSRVTQNLRSQRQRNPRIFLPSP